ncbi:MAG: TolC family protein [Planctomycetota bacterium]
MSLAQSEQCALRYSLALEAAGMGRKIAEGRILSAWGEALPTISGQYSKYLTDTYDREPSPGHRDRWSELYTAKIQARQPLFSGGRIGAGLRGARLYRESVEEDVREARQTLLYNVRVLYYQILLNEELMRVAREQTHLAEKYLEDVRKRKEVEVATDYDVLRAEVERTNEATVLTRRENDLANARSAFLRLLGLPLSSALVLTDRLEFDPLPTPDEEVFYRRALGRRPDVHKSRLGIDMQEQLIRGTRADLFPNIYLTGEYSGTSDDFERPFKDYDKSWTVGLVLDWSLFDGLLVRGRLQELRAQKEQLEILYRDLSDEVRLELRQALLDIASARSAVLSQVRNVEQARESLRLVIEREKQGVNTHLDVLTARQILAVAEQNHYQSVFAYQIAGADLELALGAIGEEPMRREEEESDAPDSAAVPSPVTP